MAATTAAIGTAVTGVVALQFPPLRRYLVVDAASGMMLVLVVMVWLVATFKLNNKTGV
jgi:hypothetical protein